MFQLKSEQNPGLLSPLPTKTVEDVGDVLLRVFIHLWVKDNAGIIRKGVLCFHYKVPPSAVDVAIAVLTARLVFGFWEVDGKEERGALTLH